MRRSVRFAAACLFLAFPLVLAAESVTIIRNNGPSANRVDFVVLGDGYTAAEMDKYASDVETFVLAVFSVEPFKEYAKYFNIIRVDVVSNESGSDKPASNIYKDTALDSYYYCNQTQRLICVNTTKVYDAIRRSGLAADQQDMVLILVNDPEYGGSGGAVAVASTHPSCLELILHEQGHSFGLLADEYDYGPPTCVNGVEPSNVNATMEKDRTKIKWNTGGGPPSGWIEPSTPVPTTGIFVSGVAGLYEGAKYCTTGLFRPTYNSLMRTLSRNYEQVNTEQLIKRVYNWVSGIDSSSPGPAAVTLAPGEKRTFQVSTPRPASHDLDIVWTMDGARVGAGAQYVVESAGAAYGAHELKVEVHDSIALVRSDPAAALTDSKTWTVSGYFDFSALKVSAAEGGTTDPPPGSHIFTAGSSSVIRAIPAANYAFAGWSGDVPAGHELDNPLTIVVTSVVSLRATFRKTLLAPLNASAERIVNRSLSQAEYVNVITFASNPASLGVAGYRIYRIDGSAWVEIASLGPNMFLHADRGVLKLREYTYAIIAFSASGMESDPAFATVR